jgi:activator of HSP90 ATPase
LAKNIRQQVTFRASPRAVYTALIDERRHAAFTGGRASIPRKIGARFRCYDGYITGYQLHLERDRRIVQAWRGSDWDEGDYSIVEFRLQPLPGGGTRLKFSQHGVPESRYAEIRQGWIEYYWNPMKAMLDGKSSPRATQAS